MRPSDDIAQRNIEVVQRAYALAGESFAARDPEPNDRTRPVIEEIWDPELVIEENPDFPDTAVYRGYEGLVQWWRGFFEIYDEIAMEPREFQPAGDRVIAKVHHRLKSKMGVELELELNHVWTLRNCRVVHMTGYSGRS
jgi:ketosteroid isomerase-like protein